MRDVPTPEWPIVQLYRQHPKDQRDILSSDTPQELDPRCRAILAALLNDLDARYHGVAGLNALYDFMLEGYRTACLEGVCHRSATRCQQEAQGSLRLSSEGVKTMSARSTCQDNDTNYPMQVAATDITYLYSFDLHANATSVPENDL